VTPIYKLLGPVKYLAYDRMRQERGAAVARAAFGLGPRTRKERVLKGPRFCPQRVPANQCPQVRWIYEEINRQGRPALPLLRRAGISEDALRSWRKPVSPRLADLEALANVLGFTFQPVPLRQDGDEP